MKKNAIIRLGYNSVSEYDTTFAQYTWDFWCNKYNCDLITENNSSYFEGIQQVKDYLDKYNKIFVIDVTAIVKWSCPNIFDLTDNRLVGWRDMGDLNSIYRKTGKRDLTKYINYGSIIINSEHRKLLNTLEASTTNNEFEVDLNKKIADIDINLDMPKSFNLNYMMKYDWLSHNWQDGEDKTPFFIKYANIWRVDSLEKAMHNNVIEQLRAGLKEHYRL